MKRIIFLFAAICFSQFTFAQYSPQWVTASQDYLRFGTMLAIDGNDNLIVSGHRPSYAGSAHIYTRKMDNFGNLLWEQVDSSGVAGKYYKSRWVNTDSQNDIFVTGYRYSGTSSEYTDTIVILKYNQSGVLLWKREIGHIWPSSLNLRSEVDADGNLYIGTVGVSPGFNLIKLNTNGNVLYNVSDASSLNQDFASMRLKGNRVVMTSYAFNGSQVSVCVFDTSGVFLWSDTFSSKGGMDVEMDDSLNIYILTQEQNVVNSTSGFDIELFKFDSMGNLLSQYNYDFGNGYDVGVRMTLVNEKISIIGKNILPGQAYMDWITFQTDLQGNKLWDARYGFSSSNDEKPYWITATTSGDVYVSGQGGPDTVSVVGTSFLRYVTVKYRNGATLWTDANPYQGYVGVANVLDSQCGLYVLGETYMTAIHYSDSCFTVGLDENDTQNREITIFPNPAASELVIQESIWVNSEYTICDVTGQNVARGNVSGQSRIDISSLPSGCYILRLNRMDTVIHKSFIVGK